VDGSHAVYNCLGDGDPACAATDILEVGSRPLGQGRFGQQDLAGSLAEWNYGWWEYSPTLPFGTSPIQKGGWPSKAAFLSAYNHNITYSSVTSNTWGVRCARAVGQP
jgi:hypothetical protein